MERTMFVRQRRPREPGYLLLNYYLSPRKISISKFAEATGLTRKHVSNIVNGRASITADTAVLFAEALETTPEFWLNLQNAVDIYDARVKMSVREIRKCVVPDGVLAV
jgi:antitoxin HigA-1